jgi:hypothetical protein
MQLQFCRPDTECGGLEEENVDSLLPWPVDAIAHDRLCCQFLAVLSSQGWRGQVVMAGVRWDQARPFCADADDNPITIRHRLLDGDRDSSQCPGLVNMRIHPPRSHRNLEQGMKEDAGAIRCGADSHHEKQTQGDALAQ